MAAEFWEQGDLERTVLEQQPIVRTPTEKPVGLKSSATCSDGKKKKEKIILKDCF